MQIVLICLLILLFFGARKLPELARGIGEAMREFKKATREAEDSIRTAMDEAPDKKTPPTAPEKKPEDKKD